MRQTGRCRVGGRRCSGRTGRAGCRICWAVGRRGRRRGGSRRWYRVGARCRRGQCERDGSGAAYRGDRQRHPTAFGPGRVRVHLVHEQKPTALPPRGKVVMVTMLLNCRRLRPRNPTHQRRSVGQVGEPPRPRPPEGHPDRCRARLQGPAKPAWFRTFWPVGPVTRSMNLCASAGWDACLRTAIGYTLVASADSANLTVLTLSPALRASVT